MQNSKDCNSSVLTFDTASKLLNGKHTIYDSFGQAQCLQTFIKLQNAVPRLSSIQKVHERHSFINVATKTFVESLSTTIAQLRVLRM